MKLSLFEILIQNPLGVAIIALSILTIGTVCSQGFKWAWFILRKAAIFAYSLLPRLNFAFFAKWFFASLLIYSFRSEIADGIGFIDQYYFNPVKFATFDADTSSATEQAFLRKLRHNVSQREYDTLMSATARMAARHGCGTLQFLEVYESECALNPFAVNVNEKGDTVAAGHIQFTRAGVEGLEVDGQKVGMWRVRKAIRQRDISFLCRLGEAYMLRASQGQRLKRSCDVYTAVFLPYFLGMPDHTVVASASGAKPEWYYQNIGLDGHSLQNGRVVCSSRHRDGKITISDLALRLAYKKAKVVREFGE